MIFPLLRTAKWCQSGFEGFERALTTDVFCVSYLSHLDCHLVRAGQSFSTGKNIVCRQIHACASHRQTGRQTQTSSHSQKTDRQARRTHTHTHTHAHTHTCTGARTYTHTQNTHTYARHTDRQTDRQAPTVRRQTGIPLAKRGREGCGRRGVRRGRGQAPTGGRGSHVGLD